MGALLFALRGAHLEELRDDLASTNWWWVAVAVVGDLSVYLMHGSRWQVLLRPVVRLNYWEPVRAIYVGLFANEIIPLRAGELVRCYILSQHPDLPLSVALTSALMERVFDGIWLCVLLIVMLRFLPLPSDMHYVVSGAYALGAAVLLVSVILSILLFRKHAEPRSEPVTKWQRQWRTLGDDLEIIGHSRSLLSSLFLGLPYLLLQVVPIYAGLRAYGFDLPLGAAFALMVILRLGSILPQAPGNIGVFQVLTRETLVKIFDVVPDEAARFSLLLWALVTLPLLIGGAVALFFSESSLGQIHSSAQAEREALGK